MERKPFIISEYLSGNWDLFKEVINNKNPVFFYDADGIIINSPETVLKEFSEKHNISLRPEFIDRWNYLTFIAQTYGLSEISIRTAEEGWYKKEILEKAESYQYIEEILGITIGLSGLNNNFVLTSREPFLKKTTKDWFKHRLSLIPTKNILIRDDSNIKPTDFKVGQIKKHTPPDSWAIFIDDSVKYVGSVLEAGISNCLTISIPLGKIEPPPEHERLVVLKRHHGSNREIYPLLAILEKALKKDS